MLKAKLHNLLNQFRIKSVRKTKHICARCASKQTHGAEPNGREGPYYNIHRWVD